MDINFQQGTMQVGDGFTMVYRTVRNDMCCICWSENVINCRLLDDTVSWLFSPIYEINVPLTMMGYSILLCHQAQVVQNWFEDYSGNFWPMVSPALAQLIIYGSGWRGQFAHKNLHLQLSKLWTAIAEHLSRGLLIFYRSIATSTCYISPG